MTSLQKRQLTQTYQQKHQQLREDIRCMEKRAMEMQTIIGKECDGIRVTLGELKEKAKQYVEKCLESLEDGNENGPVMGLADLSGYLNQEKQCLR